MRLPLLAVTRVRLIDLPWTRTLRSHVQDVISIWHTPFEADSPTNVLFIRYHDAPPVFSSLERHFHVTQGFLPVGGTPSIMVVAPPTPRGGGRALPDPATVRWSQGAIYSVTVNLSPLMQLTLCLHPQVRAFLLDGTQGVILHREIWHALSRFTLTRGAHADFYFLTDIETQLEIEAGSAASKTNAYQELSMLFASRRVSSRS